jgi:hypothetical protein
LDQPWASDVHFNGPDEDGCEIQNAACGRAGIKIRLKKVKTFREAHAEQEDNADGLNHGTKVLLQLVKPWYHRNRVVVANSYFASVECADELVKRNLKVIGVVKTSH